MTSILVNDLGMVGCELFYFIGFRTTIAELVVHRAIDKRQRFQTIVSFSQQMLCRFDLESNEALTILSLAKTNAKVVL